MRVICLFSLTILLGGLGCSKSVEEYVEQLRKGDGEERMDAAVVLGERQASAAVAVLEERLAKDDWHLVRATCARALTRIGAPKSAEAFVRALEDKSPTVRWESVLGLGRLGARTEASTIAALLKEDTDPRVRRECAKVLGLFESARHIPDLIGALEDRDATVRLHAELALRRVTLRDLGPYADDWRAWYEDFLVRMERDSG